MPIIVACPSCTGQLRVSDELIGRKVRCPACNTVFEASAEPTPASRPEPPVETVPIDPWPNLNLELTAPTPGSAPDPSAPVNPPSQTDPAPLKGAAEIDLPLDDGLPRPRPPADPAPASRRVRDEPQPRRSDEDDLRPCPGCGKMIPRDSLRCFSCGERFEERPRPRRPRRFEDEDDDDHPRRPVARRDCEPHRGGLVLTFGIIAVATLFVCWPLSPVALGFGIAAWLMGHNDLRKIRTGKMDPDGHGTTQAGWICAIIGVCLNLLVIVGCGGFYGFIAYQAVQQSNQMKQKQFIAPPPRVPPRQF